MLARNGEARRIRIAADVTLAEMGKDCRATGAAVRKWETGMSKPTGDRAVAYAAAIDGLARALGETVQAA